MQAARMAITTTEGTKVMLGPSKCPLYGGLPLSLTLSLTPQHNTNLSSQLNPNFKVRIRKMVSVRAKASFGLCSGVSARVSPGFGQTKHFLLLCFDIYCQFWFSCFLCTIILLSKLAI